MKQKVKDRLRPLVQSICRWSIREALCEQSICPHNADISDQYTGMGLRRGSYMDYKVRAMQAFQLQLTASVLLCSQLLPDNRKARLFDIGDSSGNHILWLKKVRDLDTVSFNCDTLAVHKVRDKGLDSVDCSSNQVSDFCRYNYLKRADIAVCYQTMEHMENLVAFVRTLHDVADLFLFTVPYVRRSRLGFHHLRGKQGVSTTPEDLHIFELCPADYKLLFKHHGWRLLCQETYWQYPRRHLLTPWLSLFWRHYDYEGFYGAVYGR